MRGLAVHTPMEISAFDFFIPLYSFNSIPYTQGTDLKQTWNLMDIFSNYFLSNTITRKMCLISHCCGFEMFNGHNPVCPKFLVQSICHCEIAFIYHVATQVFFFLIFSYSTVVKSTKCQRPGNLQNVMDCQTPPHSVFLIILFFQNCIFTWKSSRERGRRREGDLPFIDSFLRWL